MGTAQLSRAIRGCRFTVVPSLCRDNSPNAILESALHERAVIVPAMEPFHRLLGGDRPFGLFFKHGDVGSLAEQMFHLLNSPDEAKALGVKGRVRVLAENTPEQHYESLINLFTHLVHA